MPTASPLPPAPDDDDIVVTGLGAIGPFGLTPDALWNALLAGTPCLGPWPGETDGGEPCTRLAPADAVALFGEGADQRRRSVTMLAQAAADRAIADAALDDGVLDPTDIGIVYGTATGGSALNFVTALEHAAQARRFEVPSLGVIDDTMGAPSAGISVAHQYRGPILNLPMGWAAAGASLVAACDLLRGGVAPAVVVVVADELSGDRPTAPRGVSRTRGLLSPNDGGAPAVRPFDLRANGSALGEGAAALVLETRASARRRGRAPFARIAGWAMRSGRAHGDRAAYDTRSIGLAMSAALHALDADTRVAAVYAGAHANRDADAAEAGAIARHLGGPRPPAVTNVRGVLGDIGAVSGLYAVVAACRTLRERTLPPLAGCDEPDPRLEIDLAHTARRLEAPGPVLCNAFSSDGVATAVVLVAEPAQERP